MVQIHRSRIIHAMLMMFVAGMLFWVCKGEIAENEVSDNPSVISCRYEGLAEMQGADVIMLTFVNRTGKNLNNVFGGIRIVDSDGNIVQRTGFTYSRPFLKGEEKKIPAFRYVPLTEASRETVRNAKDFIPLQFHVSEIRTEAGETLGYE